MLSNMHSRPKNITKTQEKKKKPVVEGKTETPLAVCLTISKNDTPPQALHVKQEL